MRDKLLADARQFRIACKQLQRWLELAAARTRQTQAAFANRAQQRGFASVCGSEHEDVAARAHESLFLSHPRADRSVDASSRIHHRDVGARQAVR